MNAKDALDLALRHATYLIFFAVLLFFAVQNPAFLGAESLGNIVKQASFIGIAAIGMTFVLLTGGIDLSVGSVMYLAPLIAGYAMRAYGLDVGTGLVIAVAAGVLLGAINAVFIVWLNVIPFIVTLATMFCFRGFGIWITSSEQFDFDDASRAFGLSAPLGIPTPIWFFAGVALLAHVALSRTTFGRRVYAIGNDPEAARKAGLPVARVKASVYVISAATAALSGYILTAQITRIDAAFGEGREFDVIAAAVLGGASLFGGIGSVWSAVLGATLIQTVKNGLAFTGVNLYLQPMLQALIIFLAVLVDGVRERRIAAARRRHIRPLAGTSSG
jgi:ribose/xylose/arabinose/galactoside ABC-type transport system permease subunit